MAMRRRWDRVDAPQRDEPPPEEKADTSSVALQVIDRALRDVAARELLSSAEVVDLLLDVRSAISLDTALGALPDEIEVGDVATSCRSR